LGGIATFFGGHKPTKISPQRRDWPQPADVFLGAKCNLLLHLKTKHDFENLGRANCLFALPGCGPACHQQRCM